MMCSKKCLYGTLLKSLLERCSLFFFFALCCFLFSPEAFARLEKVPEENPPIRASRLESLLRKGALDGVTICGPDLIHVIKNNPKLNIKIKRSRILGGLDFTGLQPLSIEEILARKSWGIERKERWLKDKKSKGISEIITIENAIDISNTTIFSQKSSPKTNEKISCESITSLSASEIALNAKGLLFTEPLTFREVQFSGEISFKMTVFEGKMDFDSATFEGEADFSSDIFEGGVYFNRATFEEESYFDDSNFKKDASFSNSSFGGEVNFSRAILEKEAYFEGSTFSREAIFNDSIFGYNSGKGEYGKAFFNEATFSDKTLFKKVFLAKGANFSGAVFKKSLSFRESIFEKSTDFSNATFLEDSNFEKVQFHNKVDFSNAVFKHQGLISFREAEFAKVEGSVLFDHAIFHGELDFSHAIFSESGCWTSGGEASFVDVTFHETVHFDEAEFCKINIVDSSFKKRASFFSTQFYKEASFQETRFEGPLFFQEAAFFKTLKLEQNTFKGYINFHNAHISTLSFGDTEISGMVHQPLDFQGAKICEARIRNLIFLKDVDFSYTEMGFNENGKADKYPSCHRRDAPLSFYALSFEEGAFFVESQFRGRTLFDKVKFKKEVSFARAKFYKNGLSGKRGEDLPFLLSNVSFGVLSLTWDQLPELESWRNPSDDTKKETPQTKSEDSPSGKYFAAHIEPLSDALLKLESHFKKNDQLSDANEAFYAIKEEERKKALGFWEEVLYFLWWLAFGYGRSFWVMLVASILIHLPFTLLYFFFGELFRIPSKDLEEESIFKIKMAVLPGEYLTRGHHKRDKIRRFKLVNAFLLSVLLLLKVGYRNMCISGKSTEKASKSLDVIKLLVRVEWTFGYIWLLAVLYTLRNTVPFLKTLISL